ncbi:MAG TPA: mersacidin/lichenicidin family type 2 lantibiotic [Polyangia bacterium]|jgi:mersacidin/lichenicidin family type 2 lantibiotic|nr:mersacidin/lichenicidin family type 2 lantibiotic [Polyangia bacterium]
MSHATTARIIRAWRDPDDYNSLSEEERTALPRSPALGVLDPAELPGDGGGAAAAAAPTTGYCTLCENLFCIS